MLAHGDIEAVNLRTGEQHRRVSGNGGSFLESLGIPGLRPLNAEERESLAEYEREMREVAIPAILEEIKLRARLAAEARKSMHYRNGREAKNGDKIVQIGGYGSGAAQVVALGVLYDAKPQGGNACNGGIASVQPSLTAACLCDCLHVDDLAAILAEKGLDKRPEGK